MVKNFLSKILARDLNGLNIISTYCEDSTTSVSEIKYLKKNKKFLLFLTRKYLKDKKKSKFGLGAPMNFSNVLDEPSRLLWLSMMS